MLAPSWEGVHLSGPPFLAAKVCSLGMHAGEQDKIWEGQTGGVGRPGMVRGLHIALPSAQP